MSLIATTPANMPRLTIRKDFEISIAGKIRLVKLATSITPAEKAKATSK